MQIRQWAGVMCLGALVAALAGQLAACTPDVRSYGMGGSGGSGASGGSGGEMTGGMAGSGGSAGGFPLCVTDQECLQFECQIGVCVNGLCDVTNESDGKVTVSQVFGDCKERVCDGMGGVKLIDGDPAQDSYTWGNPCYVPGCDAQFAPLANDGAACTTTWGKSGKCSNFYCQECTANGDCPNQQCQNGRCIAVTCSSGMREGTETDIDCGGLDCLPCKDGSSCTTNSDCAGSCDLKTLQCLPPSCTDLVRNGDETDIDCGGSCALNDPLRRCAAAQQCLYPSDCLSGVCISGSCQTPSCTDYVQNQDEVGIDCAGSCPLACPKTP